MNNIKKNCMKSETECKDSPIRIMDFALCFFYNSDNTGESAPHF